MIIALEGAPAVGKTTIAKRLAREHGFTRIAEVNERIAKRPRPEPRFWYCEQQLARCRAALAHENTILDGDPFQSVWFGWMYPERVAGHWSQSLQYISKRRGDLVLPDHYVCLHIDREERFRRARKRDYARGRTHEQFERKWHRYVDFDGPQNALFRAMDATFPSWVTALETNDVADVVNRLSAMAPSRPPSTGQFTSWLYAWLDANASSNFR